MFEFDDLGPEKVLQVYNPKVGMHGYVVLDNLALGVGKGGIRMTPTVDLPEVAKLARTMSYKNAMAGLPFGGAKAGIVADDKTITKEKKKEIIESFALALKEYCPKLYVAGPDMNIGEEEMGWFSKTLKKDKISVAVEGFGNVGWFVCKFLSEEGIKLVGVSDSKGVIYNKNGLNFEKLDKAKKEKGTVTNYNDGKVLPSNNIINLDVDVLITAAIPDLIKVGDVDKVKAKLII